MNLDKFLSRQDAGCTCQKYGGSRLSFIVMLTLYRSGQEYPLLAVTYERQQEI